MERHSITRLRVLTGCAMTVSTVLAFGTGCRSTRSEVPPHRPFDIQQRQAPPISYSGLDTNPADGLPAVTTGNPSAYGTPAPGATNNYGAPTPNSYGPPGSSTLGTLPGGDATKPGFGTIPQVGGAPGATGRPAQVPTQSPFSGQ